MAEKGAKARALAGGTDLLIHLRAKVFELDRVVDMKKIPDLSEIALSGEGLTLGAAVPCYQIYENDAVREAYPALFDYPELEGCPTVRAMQFQQPDPSALVPESDKVFAHYRQPQRQVAKII